MNLSLGDGSSNSSFCSGDSFATPISNAKSAGILAAIASGNDSHLNGISSPACVPAAVSVGAVYDSNLGQRIYGSCTDSTTFPDKVTCFSNSANILTILAPGADISAASITMYGTSQATPHIAGSIAVLKGTGAFPADTADQTVSRMTSTGVSVTDGRNSIIKPRINLLAATGGSSPTFSISGTVTFGGNPLSGVTMTLSGAASSTTTTDASGNYSFTGLANGNYTVTPSRTGYTFTPVNRAVIVSSANVTAQNFTAALAPTYSISGTVSFGGSPLSAATMTLSGASSGTTTTDASGNYSFTGLANGNYTVTPSRTGYTFTPVNRAVTVSSANVTAQNFTAALTTYSISGSVATSGGGLGPGGGSGSPVSGVTMTLSGASSGTATTDASGNFSFTGLANGNYTVTPARTGYTFIPLNKAVTVSSANVTAQNFTAQAVAPSTYSISGTVTSGGSPLSGVTMTLSGAASNTTTTNASGNYSFSGLTNGNYTVTPGLAGFTFTPVNRAVTISSVNIIGQDFTAQTVVPGNFSISGNVATSGGFGPGGGPLSGVTMTLTGSASAVTTTNASGNYTFTGLANGPYTVTPSRAGYAFTPINRAVTINNANVTAQNFTAQTSAATYSISGTVTSGGSPLSGVSITLSGAASNTTTTNASGNYTFTGLANGNYTVTPGLAGFTFTPVNRAVTINSANITAQNFTAQASTATYSISGRVTTSGGGIGGGLGGGGLSGVTMTLSGAASGTTTTDASGNYSFSGLANGNYTVTPTKAGNTFTPVSRAVTVSGANVISQNFTGM